MRPDLLRRRHAARCRAKPLPARRIHGGSL